MKLYLIWSSGYLSPVPDRALQSDGIADGHLLPLGLRNKGLERWGAKLAVHVATVCSPAARGTFILSLASGIYIRAQINQMPLYCT